MEHISFELFAVHRIIARTVHSIARTIRLPTRRAQSTILSIYECTSTRTNKDSQTETTHKYTDL
jgi:hypothetical protein